MLDYETLRIVWWLLLGALLIGFAVTDGFDLGVGALFRFLGRSDEERRALLESIEPVWEGNQVWFILGGGAVFAAWPLLYAASFSGLYLAMFLVLLAFILRPVGFTFRNKLEDRRWRNVWDWALFVGGALPALLFGVAFGNLFLGLPFHIDALSRPVYTGSFFALLHPFALLVGLVSLSMLLMHGSIYLQIRTEGAIAERARRATKILGAVFLLAFILAGVWVMNGIDGYRIVSMLSTNVASTPLDKVVEKSAGAWMSNYHNHALLWLAPLLGIAGAALAIVLSGAKKPISAFVASSAMLAGVIFTAGIAMFPFIMPSSSEPRSSLTVWDATSSHMTLNIMFWVTMFFLPIVLGYTIWSYWHMRGRVTVQQIQENTHSAY